MPSGRWRQWGQLEAGDQGLVGSDQQRYLPEIREERKADLPPEWGALD